MKIEEPSVSNNNTASNNTCYLRVSELKVSGYMVKAVGSLSLVPLSSFTEAEFLIEVYKSELITAANLTKVPNA